MTKVIRISEETYTRLSLIKRGHSFNEYVDIILNYFEATKIDPKTCQESPAVAYLKEIDRLVRIVKSQEKKYSEYYNTLFGKVDFIESVFRNVEQFQGQKISLEDLEKEGLTLGDLQVLQDKLAEEDQDKIIIEKENEIRENLKTVFFALDKLNEQKSSDPQDGTFYTWENDWFAVFEGMKKKVELNTEIGEITLADCTFQGIGFADVKFLKREKQKSFSIYKDFFDKMYSNVLAFHK